MSPNWGSQPPELQAHHHLPPRTGGPKTKSATHRNTHTSSLNFQGLLQNEAAKAHLTYLMEKMGPKDGRQPSVGKASARTLSANPPLFP